MSALAVLIAGLAGASSAQAGFVPALGSPFPYEAPTTALSVGDADRNGTVDVAAGGLTLRRGAGSGFLGNPITIGAVGAVEGVASGDLNGDGWLDYAAIASGVDPGDPRRLLRFLAVPGNGYIQETVLTDVSDATDIAVANVNGDGLPDLIVVRADVGSNVTVMLGGLPIVEDYESGLAAPADVETGDLTGDGLPEIVVAGDQPSVSVLTNEGGGTFADGDLEPTGGAIPSPRIALTQLDNDGRLDLIATAPPSSVVRMLGDGEGGFLSRTLLPSGLSGSPVSSISAGDVDGDGLTDILAGGGRSVAVTFGDVPLRSGPTRGALQHSTGSPVPGDPVDDVVAADMNRDGQLDLVTANRGGSVSVLLNDETGLLSAAPASVGFGTMLPATGLRTRTVMLRANRGRLRITRLDRQGSKVFTVRDIDCVGRTLLLGQSCSLAVTFNAPRRARRYEGLLSVDANAAAVVIPLRATTRAPVVRGVRLKSKRVAPGKRLNLRYRLSEGALTRVLTEQALPGRRVGGRCFALTRGNARRRPCTFWQRVAAVTRRDLAGRQRMRVVTREKSRGLGRKRRGGTAYPVGTYRLSVSALDRFRNRSLERTVRFVIVPRPKDPSPVV